MKKIIPLFRTQPPDLDSVRADIFLSYESGVLTNFGPINEKCGELLSARNGGYWLPVTNGSFAVELAVRTLPEWVKRVAVPNFTFAATIQAVIRAGKKPIIFQNNNDLSFDVDLLEEHRRKFDAVLGVVPFGHDINNSRLEVYCKINKIPLCWDLAGCFPMMKDGVCSYSFHASKSLPVGEGGMVYFDDDFEAYKKAKQFICFGFNDKKECVDENGFNMKMDEIRASILWDFIEREKYVLRQTQMNWIHHKYSRSLKKFAITMKPRYNHSMSLCVYNLRRSKDLQKHLEKNGITSRRYYAPLLNEHPAFKKYPFYGKHSNSLNNWLALPSDITPSEQKKIIRKINGFYSKDSK